jgi:DNA-binding transcriptional regulator GbsR (MarR family)
VYIIICYFYYFTINYNGEIVKVTDENVQKEIDINTEVLGIVNSEIVKETDENLQKEIDINTEVLGIVSVHSHLLLLLFHY